MHIILSSWLGEVRKIALLAVPRQLHGYVEFEARTGGPLVHRLMPGLLMSGGRWRVAHNYIPVNIERDEFRSLV